MYSKVFNCAKDWLKPFPFCQCNQPILRFSFTPKTHAKSCCSQGNASISGFLSSLRWFQHSHTNILWTNRKRLFAFWFFLPTHFPPKSAQDRQCSSCIFLNLRCTCKNCSPNQIKFHKCFFLIQQLTSAYCHRDHTN
jgi:hypothetical protein